MKKLLVVFVVLLCAGCAAVPITGRRQLSIVPPSDLLTLSEANYQKLLSESPRTEDEKIITLVNTVGTNISRAAEDFLKQHGMAEDVKHYAWEFNVIEDPKTVNAFCMSGGKIVVFTGILPVTQDATGLAVVLGHEVAHALANHGGERMSHLLLVELGGKKLADALVEKPKKTQQLLMTAYGVTTQIGFVLPYSRVQESEADRIGLILMASAGYDPEAAVSFWQRMDTLSQDTPFEFLSTHPANENRIEQIKALIPEAKKYYKK